MMRDWASKVYLFDNELKRRRRMQRVADWIFAAAVIGALSFLYTVLER